ncbi:MAG TPA: hypothetical protein VGB79_12925 [Allosphingosinicella sp.]|jgi:hypothetical protein
MAIKVNIHDAEPRGPDCDRVVLGMPGTFEEIPHRGDRIQGQNATGDYFTGRVEDVRHTLDSSKGTYVPEVFVSIDG